MNDYFPNISMFSHARKILFVCLFVCLFQNINQNFNQYFESELTMI